MFKADFICVVVGFAMSSFFAQASSSNLDVIQCEKLLQQKGLKKGFLFSAVRLQNSTLGWTWGSLRDQAVHLFPNLKFKKTADLHITVVHIGEWDFRNVPTYRASAVVSPIQVALLEPELVQMGRKQQVIAVELHGIPEDWAARVILAKSGMAQSGLKKPDSFDQSFRAHVTLAEALSKEPTEQELIELSQFKKWVSNKLDPKEMRVTISADTPVELLLAGSSRPKDGPDYILLSDFLETLLQ